MLEDHSKDHEAYAKLPKPVTDERKKPEDHTNLVEFEFLVRGSKRVPFQYRYGYVFEIGQALREIDGVQEVMITLEKYYV